MQDVLLFALAERRDCADPAFLPWAAGAIRNHARFVARTSGRRRRREAALGLPAVPEPAELPRFPPAFLAGLPRARRVVAQLVNLGMDRREIGYLLGLGEVALRQRIAGLKRAWLGFAGDRDAAPQRPAMAGNGPARRALKAGLPRVAPRSLAIRDPDGMPIFFRCPWSRPERRRQLTCGKSPTGERAMAIGIDSVTIIFTVSDMARSERFYREHVGLSFEQHEEEGHAFLMTILPGGVELMVFEGEPKPGNTPNVVFGLAAGGVDTLVERLAAAGAEIVTPVSPAPGGWFAEFRDPDGQLVSYYQSRDRPRRLA